MLKLVISKGDGTHYWTEHFKTKDELDLWLAEEQTRKYWEKDFSWVITDLSLKKEEIDRIAKQRKDREDAFKKAKDDIVKITPADLKTQAGIEDAIMKLNIALRAIVGG